MYGIITDVLVITASIFSGFMFAVIGSTSTNTGFKLFQTIRLAVAKNENGEVITLL